MESNDGTCPAHDRIARDNRLTERLVIPYLLERQVLNARAIVDGDAEVINMSRRNLNLRVQTTGHHDYLVKKGIGAERGETVRREAEFLMTTATGLEDRVLKQHLPQVRDWNAGDRILVFNLAAGTHSLAEHHLRTGRCASGIARQVGTVLRRLHRWHPDTTDLINNVIVDRGPPGVLTIHRPDIRMFEDMSGSGLDIIKIVQETPGLCRGFDDLRSTWRSSHVIHGDLKWDNVVLAPNSDGKRGFQVQLIDWESVQLGDPLWDAASFLSQYLDTWIASIPGVDSSPQSQASAASMPLERLRPAMRHFWDGYSRGRRDRVVALERTVRYAAARLVQFAIEADQHSAMLSATSVIRLQVAHNMLERPLSAATSLLGLPV